MTAAGELMALDKRIRQELPDTFREGMHLAQLYAVAHQNPALNEMNAFRLIRDAVDLPLDTELILSVYRALTEDTEAECRGWKPRNCHVKCGDGFYIPATWEETPSAMETLCEKYRYLGERPEAFFGGSDGDKETDARLDDICRFMLEFACIHPMLDGNGRLSVLLGQMLLQKAGFSCAIYTPWDSILKLYHSREHFLHIIRASGICYGMKPLEDDLFVPFMKDTLAEAYHCLETAIRRCR